MPTCANCGIEIPTGCTCCFRDTDTVAWSGRGSATNPLVPSLRLDPAADNQLVISGGLLAVTPARFLTVPRVRLRHSVAQTITTGVFTVLAFDTEVYDTDGMHSTVTNTSRITIVTPGLYSFGGSIEYASNATGNYRSLWIQRNGVETETRFVTQPAQDTSATYLSASQRSFFDAGEYLEMFAQQDSGGNLNVNAVNEASPIFYATFRGDQP